MTSGKCAERAIGRMKRVALQRLLSIPIEVGCEMEDDLYTKIDNDGDGDGDGDGGDDDDDSSRVRNGRKVRTRVLQP